MDDQPETKHCSNCLRDIAVVNFVMHEVHCRRNIMLCEKCLEPVPRCELEAHHEEVHAGQACELCSKDIEKCQMENHKTECPRRLQQCAYCELEMSFCELAAHQDYCGTRTEPCTKCGSYVMVKDTNRHEDSNCSFPLANKVKLNNTQGSGTSSRTAQSSSRNNVPNLDYFNNFAMDELQRILDSEVPANTNNASVSTVQPANFYGSRRPNNDASFHSNISQSQRNHNVNTNAQGDSSDNLDRLLAMHLSSDMSPDQNHFTSASNPDNSTGCDIGVLCELCGEPFPAEIIFDHQDICTGPPSVSTHGNNLYSSSSHTPAPLPAFFDNTSNVRLLDFNLPAHNVALDCDSDDQDVMLPCEFCELTFPSELLVQHQAVCERNSTSTPLPPNSPANMRTRTSYATNHLSQTRVPSTRKLRTTKNSTSNLSRVARRQPDPSLPSLLGSCEASGGATFSGSNNTVISNDIACNNLPASSSASSRLGSGRARVSSTNTHPGQQAWTNHTTRPANFATNFPTSHSNGISRRNVASDKNSNDEATDRRRRGSAARVKQTLNHLIQNPTGNDSSDDFIRTTPTIHDKKSKSRLNQQTRDQQRGIASGSGTKQPICDGISSPEVDVKPRNILSATRRRHADNTDTYNASFAGGTSRRVNKLRTVPKKNVEANLESSLRVNNNTRSNENTSKSTKKPSKTRKPPAPQGDS